MRYLCAVPTKCQKGAPDPLELRLQTVTWFLTSEPSLCCHYGCCCCYYLGTEGLPTTQNALSTCSKHLASPQCLNTDPLEKPCILLFAHEDGSLRTQWASPICMPFLLTTSAYSILNRFYPS